MTWDEVRQEAFGEIGLLPEDFYLMDKDDYWLLHKGFFNKRVYEQRVLRNVVMTMIAPWVKSMPSPFQIMPLPGDDELRKQIDKSGKERGMRVSEAALITLKRHKEKERLRNG